LSGWLPETGSGNIALLRRLDLDVLAHQIDHVFHRQFLPHLGVKIEGGDDVFEVGPAGHHLAQGRDHVSDGRGHIRRQFTLARIDRLLLITEQGSGLIDFGGGQIYSKAGGETDQDGSDDKALPADEEIEIFSDLLMLLLFHCSRASLLAGDLTNDGIRCP